MMIILQEKHLEQKVVHQMMIIYYIKFTKPFEKFLDVFLFVIQFDNFNNEIRSVYEVYL